MGRREERRRKEYKAKHRVGSVISTIVLLIALAVFCFAAYKLVTIYLAYKVGEDEYAQLESFAAQERVTEGLDESMAENDTMEDEWGDSTLSEAGGTRRFEVMENPVDFDSLLAMNSDIIGWLEMEAVDINYPIVQGEDNDYYLHRTFQRTDNFAGSIFMDYLNRNDFSQRNSILYGHNMKNGSMFGSLKKYREKEVFDSSHYFWIYTKNRIYKYEIFSCAEVSKFGPDYQITFQDQDDFMEFVYRAQDQSIYDTGVDVNYKDTIVTLSTCTGNEATRFIVQGKRVRTYEAVSKAGGYGTEGEGKGVDAG